jgi:transcriptional regulator with XRE-family HTH domain
MTLKEWRKANRHSMASLAELYTEKTGRPISHQTINNYERGATVPDVDLAEAIRKITGGKVKPDSFARKEPPASP